MRKRDIVKEKASKIKLLFLDVDGVMTAGRITMDDLGAEIKSFDVKDGLGLKMLMSQGIEVILVTGRKSKVVEMRSTDLGIEGVYQAVRDKGALCSKLVKVRGLEKEEVCCMGDDLPDLAMFEAAGLRIAVADGAREIQEQADLITKHGGGSGAVREVCEFLLKSKGKWQEVVSAFMGKITFTG